MNGPFVVVLKGGLQTRSSYMHFMLLLYFSAGFAWLSAGVQELMCARVRGLVYAHVCA